MSKGLVVRQVKRGQIMGCHGKMFVFFSRSGGKPVEDFKQVQDMIRFMLARDFGRGFGWASQNTKEYRQI